MSDSTSGKRYLPADMKGYAMNNGDGFIYAKTIPGDGTAVPVTSAEWEGSQSLLWFHIDLSDKEIETWLQTKSGFSDIVANALTMDDTRPRVAGFEDGVVVCLRGVNCNAGADPEDMVALRIWIGERRILTLRHRQVMAIQDLDTALTEGNGPRTRGEFLAMICTRLTDRIANVVDQIGDEIDDVEELVVDGGTSSIRARLSDLRRRMIRFRRYLAPQRDVLNRLSSDTLPWLEAADRLQVRECADRTVRCIEDLDALRDRAAVLHEELNVQLSEQMNRNFYMMSIVATIFLPLGLITGLLGINVGGIPGSETPWAFIVVCVILVGIAGIEFFYFRKQQIINKKGANNE